LKKNQWKKAREIIFYAKKGAPNIPVSVKIRLGYKEDLLDEFLPELLKEEPAVITIHLRTRNEMSKVPAKWERIKDAIKIRDNLNSKTLIFGNGDIKDPKHAIEIYKKTNCDGIMIGRGIFGKPWLFENLSKIKKGKKIHKEISVKDRLSALVEHTKLFEKLLPHKNFYIMKKHYKAYCEGFFGAKDLRIKLMETNSAREVEEIIRLFLNRK
jgi:tRNA-dihydrouridine synthase